MSRVVDISTISDGKEYRYDDSVRIGCDGCDGKSICCHEMCDTIILDPYDIYSLQCGLGLTFDELLTGTIELNVEDGIILPNIKKQPFNQGCGYLDDKGRCNIHDYRPGFCRLFPLGRAYENDKLYYFVQIHECKCNDIHDVDVKDWIGIENIKEYEKFILSWHKYIKALKEKVRTIKNPEEIKSLSMNMLKLFYLTPYDTEKDFYTQFNERLGL